MKRQAQGVPLGLFFMWQFISKYIGWRNWAVLQYNSIFENLFVLFYIVIIQSKATAEALLDIILFLLLSLFSTTYGFLINDFADRELDKKHQKSNTFEQDSTVKAIAILGLIIGINLLLLVPFWRRPFFLLLWTTWFLISTFYSLPPIRLKEQGKVGLVFVVFAQRVIPILLVFSLFGFNLSPDVFLILIYILLRGASSDINHQVEDYKNDLSTGTKTAAVEIGLERFVEIFKWVLELERIFLLTILVLLAWRLLKVSGLTPFAGLVPLIIYSLIFGIGEWAIHIRKKSLKEINPYSAEKNIFQTIHLVYPNIFLPVYLILILAYHNWLFAFFFLFYLIVFRLYDPKTIRSSFLFKTILKKGRF